MKIFITLIAVLFLNYSLEAGSVRFVETSDEFTDTKQITVAIFGDENNSILQEWIFISCNPDLQMGIKKGIMISFKNVVEVTFRFDKNEAYEENFLFSNNLAVTNNKKLISRFLQNLSGSTQLILKIQDIEGVMRFTNLSNTKESVENFYASGSSIPECDL